MSREVPSRARLTAVLNTALTGAHRGAGHTPTPVTVVTRLDEVSRSTFASEVVTCQVQGRPLQIFCKYSRKHGDPAWHRAHGHRRGVTFEADVYAHVLRPLGVSAPALLGIHRHAAQDETWLLLEYLDQAVSVNKDPSLMPEAAAWAGRLHALSERRLDDPAYRFLPQYDRAYYRGWVDRVRRYAKRHDLGGRWLNAVCLEFENTIADLLNAPRAVIHGEYYPANILLHRQKVRPVDWETAAVACGEIDVACLTEGWSAALSRECEYAYRDARWPAGAPRGFQRRLRAARFYMLFRWAGERTAWTTKADRDQHLARLRATGERLGVC